MSRKLTIRRVGSHIPTICLVGFLFLCLTVAWLSLVGLPDSVLRRVEQLAAEQGVVLRLESLRLAPYKGLALKAEDIQIYAAPEDTTPLLTARSITVGIKAFRLLFTGTVCPDSATLKRANITLPVTDSPGESLKLSDITIATEFDTNGNIRLSSAFLNVGGIMLRVSGDIRKGTKESSTGSETQQSGQLDIKALLAEYAPYTDKLFHVLNSQNWAEHEMPNIHVHMDVDDKLTLSVQAELPRYDYKVFHFRNAKVDLAYKDDTITLHMLSFETVDPTSSASLQAAYESELRNLGFDFDSNASLIPLITQILGEEKSGILAKLTHAPDKAPRIHLRGTLGLEPDFTLTNLTLNGELEQQELYVDGICVDKITLSFFYKDGNFNLNGLNLRYADSDISLSATANNGKGHAILSTDLNIKSGLELLNKLLPEPVQLPDELKLGERLKLQLTADLTTGDFVPGQSNWQDFTPNLSALDLSIKLDKLSYDGLSFTAPELYLAAKGIHQAEDKRPTGAEQLVLEVSANEIAPSEQIKLEGLDLKVIADKLNYSEEKLSIAKIELSPREKHLLRKLTMQGALLEENTTHITLDDVSWAQNQLRVSNATVDSTATKLKHENMEAENLHLHLAGLKDLNSACDAASGYFSSGQITATVDKLSHENTSLGNAVLGLVVAEGQQGQAKLTLTLPGKNNEPVDNSISTRIDCSNLRTPTLHDIRLSLAPESFAEILEHFHIDIPQIKLPETLTAQGYFTYNTDKGRLESAKFDLDIPQLVRTPGQVKVFKGSEIPVGLKAQVKLSPGSADNIDYHADLKLTHGADCFEGIVNGSTHGVLTVSGTNTIRADVVDKLIDDETAHNIIRDFRFGPNARNVITDIDVKVDYSDDLRVDSFCNVELHNTEYQLCVIEDDAKGNEVLRKDLGKNPYTMAKHATCYVRSKVRYHTPKEGKPTPKDECVITIGDITMLFDNAPWFRNTNMEGTGLSSEALKEAARKHANTTMVGDAVIIDVENSFVELVNISGTVFPAYSLGMYYAPLKQFLEDVVLPYPAKVETKSCVFPIYSDCKRPMSGLIKTEVAQRAGFRFLGTTIPLKHFSGFIHLTDDYVLLDKMNAACWEGVLDAVVKIDFSGARTAFDGMVTAKNMNLSSILKSYDVKYGSALCNGHLRFRSPTPDLKDIQGYGEASVVNGDLMGFSIFQPVASLVTDLPDKLMIFESAAKSKENGREPSYIANIFSGTGNAITSIGNQAGYLPGYNHLFAYDIQDAHAKFAIANGHLRAYDMKALGYNLNVKMKLDVDLETTYIRGNLWPSITSLPTIILSPITFLSDFMIDILIYGKIDDLQWKFGLDRNLRDNPPSATSKPAETPYKPKHSAPKAG